MQKLTEVDTAVAVAVGNTALVGVTLDGSYRGGVDDRLQAMVLDRAQAVHPGIEVAYRREKAGARSRPCQTCSPAALTPP